MIPGLFATRKTIIGIAGLMEDTMSRCCRNSAIPSHVPSPQMAARRACSAGRFNCCMAIRAHALARPMQPAAGVAGVQGGGEGVRIFTSCHPWARTGQILR